MGYESTFIVGEPLRGLYMPSIDTGVPVSVVATFDMSKLGYESHTFKYVMERQKAQGKELRYMVWAMRGDIYTGNIKQALEDKYGVSYRDEYPDRDWVDAGDIRVVHDAYDNPLTDLNLPRLITAVEADAESSDYRRYAPFLALLDSFETQLVEGRWHELVVLHYGH